MDTTISVTSAFIAVLIVNASIALVKMLLRWWSILKAANVVILATTNQGKLDTWKRVLGTRWLNVVSAADICRERGIEPPEVEETGSSFAENAMAKAVAFSKLLGLPVWAEDSGIALRSTGWGYEWPGLYSNRFLGERSADGEAERNALREKAYKLGDRHAKFTISIVRVDPDGSIRGVTHEVEGDIVPTGYAVPTGHGEAGTYGPIFIRDGHDVPVDMSGGGMDHREEALRRLLKEGAFR